jgi:hypothetical protein
MHSENSLLDSKLGDQNSNGQVVYTED